MAGERRLVIGGSNVLAVPLLLGFTAAGTGYLIGESREWSSGGILAAGLTTAAGVAHIGGPVG